MELNVRRLLAKTFISLAMLSLCLDISNCNSNSQIPMSVHRKLSGIKSTAEFINKMIKPSSLYGQANRSGDSRKMESQRTGSNNNDLSSMINETAPRDACDPRPMSVCIPPDSDPMVTFWPPCTPLDRCGGCCNVDQLECVPTSTENVTIKVWKSRSNSEKEKPLNYMGHVEVTLERHLACDCRCKIKPDDCDLAIQVYDGQSCMCRCSNADQATSCQNPKKWEEKHCRCVCPNVIKCLEDEYFNSNTCSCVRRPLEQVRAPGANHPANHADPCAGTHCRRGQTPRLVDRECRCRSDSIVYQGK